MRQIKTVLHLCFALSLAACGGGSLSIDPLPEGTLQLNFPAGEPIEHRLPFRISGGIPPYESSIDGCPDWVTLFPDQGLLAGTAPAGDQGRTFFCTYRVTESDPGFRPPQSVSYGLRLTVGPGDRDALALPTPSRLSLTVGTYHSGALPAATGGVEPYAYSFACAGGQLPSGMAFAPATRTFAGTPSVRFRDSCTYSVTDSAQPAATVFRAVEVEVTGAATPPLRLPVPSRLSLTVGTYHSGALPAATGGVEPYAYSFACAGGQLPSGMAFAPATRTFAGTPSVRFRDSCTYSVTDSAQPTATVFRAVEVEVTGGAVSLALPENVVLVPGGASVNRIALTMQQLERRTFVEAFGGVQPYTYEILDCTLPDGLRFSSVSRTLSGTPLETYRGPDCTYRVTDSASASVLRDFELIVNPLDRRDWRFRTRTVAPGGPCAVRSDGAKREVAILPHAQGGEAGQDVYDLIDLPDRAHEFLSFDRDKRRLTYTHRSADPILGTPSTYRYRVGTGDLSDPDNVHDALCVDIQFNPGPSAMCGDPRAAFTDPQHPDNYIHIQLQVRDDAFYDGNEYRCPDATAPTPRSSTQGVSNPVHQALGPVHARRAVDVAHAAVRNRVRRWSQDAPRVLSAISPTVGIASLSGRSEGFDYTGSSESLSAGAELGAGSWHAGLVASFTRTDLHYRAGAELSERGYLVGEHDTNVLSLHPFAAWHAPSGGHFWASLGAGLGELRHRDDLGFPSWSHSDVYLRAYAAGASVPLADILSGELQAEAGIESFAFEIEGGGRISSSLPTLRGRDYRAGLAWSAPIPGAPSVSMAYKHLTGDGPEGGQLETRVSVSVAGIFDPRLSLTGSAEALFGLGEYEHDFWSLGAGVRFAPNSRRHGFGIDLDTRLSSLGDQRSSDVGIRGEAGYGLWGGPFLGTVRPYVGLIRYSGDQSVRRTLGVDLRDSPNSQVKIEALDQFDDRSRAIRFTVRHRF